VTFFLFLSEIGGDLQKGVFGHAVGVIPKIIFGIIYFRKLGGCFYFRKYFCSAIVGLCTVQVGGFL
jgi:hypothetical protein